MIGKNGSEKDIALQISRINRLVRNDEEYVKKFRINKNSEKEIILPPVNEKGNAVGTGLQIYQSVINTYCITINDICNYLKVNRQWVDKYIKNNVEHLFLNITLRDFLMRVAYANADLIDFEDEEIPVLKDYYYFSKVDFEKWLREHIKREKQTIRVDFSQYVNSVKLQELNEFWDGEIRKIEYQDLPINEKKIKVNEIDGKMYEKFVGMLPAKQKKLWNLSNIDRMDRKEIPVELGNEFELPQIYPFYMDENYIDQHAISQLKDIDFSEMNAKDIYYTVLAAKDEVSRRDEFVTLQEYRESYRYNSLEMVYRELYSAGAIRYTIEVGEKGCKILYFKPHDPEVNMNDGIEFTERYSKTISYKKYRQIIEG